VKPSPKKAKEEGSISRGVVVVKKTSHPSMNCMEEEDMKSSP